MPFCSQGVAVWLEQFLQLPIGISCHDTYRSACGKCMGGTGNPVAGGPKAQEGLHRRQITSQTIDLQNSDRAVAAWIVTSPFQKNGLLLLRNTGNHLPAPSAGATAWKMP